MSGWQAEVVDALKLIELNVASLGNRQMCEAAL